MTSRATREVSVKVYHRDIVALGQLIVSAEETTKRPMMALMGRIETAILRNASKRGLSFPRFLEVAKEYLGDFLLVPKTKDRTPQWATKLSHKLRMARILSESDAIAVCYYANSLHKGKTITLEYLVDNAQQYLGLARR